MVFQGLPGFVGHPAIINVNITLIVKHIKSAPEHKVHFLPNTGIVCASYRQKNRVVQIIRDYASMII